MSYKDTAAVPEAVAAVPEAVAAPAPAAPASEDKPRKSIVADSMRKVQDAGKRAVEALKDAISGEVDATPTASKYAELYRYVNDIMNDIVADHRNKRARGARNVVSLNESLAMIMEVLLQAMELVERAHDGRVKSSKGKVIEVSAEARKQLVIDMVRVSINHHTAENPTFYAAWNAFRITADATIDALIAVSRGEVKINAFADKKKSRSCFSA